MNKTTLKTLTASLLFLSANSYADLGDKLERTWDESTGISKLYLGGNNTSVDFGISHERRKGNVGIDAMVTYSAGNDTAGAVRQDSQTLLGSSLMYHLQDNSNADVFIGTGLAAIIHDDVNGTTETETTFGPMFKVGSSYYFNKDWSVGMEYLVGLNWTDDTLSSQSNFGYITLGYTY